MRGGDGNTDLKRAGEALQGLARAFASHDEMLPAVELDALFICVPPFAHEARVARRRMRPMPRAVFPR